MAQINAAPLSAVAVFGAQVPGQGPRVIPVLIDTTLADTFTLDYSNEQQRGLMQMIQGVFIDAQNVDAPVQVICEGSQQVLTVKGRTQGYYPLLCPNPFKAVIKCADDGGLVRVLFYNFPISTGSWVTQ